MPFKRTWQVAKATLSQFMAHGAMQLGAALAFYTIFSLAPILVIVIAVAGIVWGEEAIEGEVLEQVEANVGEDAAHLIQTIIQGASDVGQGIIAIVLGAIATIVGATGVFAQLKASLNHIWGVKPKPGQPILGLLWSRLLSFAMVLTIAFLLLVSLVVSSTVSAVVGYADQSLPMPSWVLSLSQYLVSLGIISLLFAVIFKYLPDIEIQWKDVWIGAMVTAVLFVVGESLLSLYLTYSSVGSSYGAAGSLVLLLMWVYYSSLIFLLGAEFTQVYSNQVGSGSKPSSLAVPEDAPES